VDVGQWIRSEVEQERVGADEQPEHGGGEQDEVDVAAPPGACRL
jgi:hypothetical protein